MFTFKRIILIVFSLYALCGVTAAAISGGMKASNGPFLAGVPASALLQLLQVVLVERRWALQLHAESGLPALWTHRKILPGLQWRV